MSDPRKVTYQMCVAYLRDLGKGWVCEVSGEVVGFCVASLRDSSIWALFVRPAYEGKGVGKHLLALATDWLFEKGASRISLSTDANTRAERFYQSRGWVRGEIRPDGEVNFTLDRPGRT